MLAVEAWAELGVVPAADARGGPRAGGLRRRRDPRAGAGHRHDVAAFVDVVQERVGPPAGAWVHYGLTSSDVVDTALVAAADAGRRPARSTPPPRSRPRSPTRAREFRDTPMVGRTHGIHAEPTTFGAKLALWALQVRPRPRAAARARRARSRSASCRARSARTPTSTPRSRRYVCERLGLTPVPATQVLARDRHAELLYACASVGRDRRVVRDSRSATSSAPRCARSRRRSATGQKGSSAMPHKRNPIKSRAALRPGPRAARQPAGRRSRTSRCGTSATSRTRRSSASSSPTRCMLAYYVLVKFRQIVEGLRVYPERMLREPRRVVRARVQPAGAARAGRGGHDARRRVPHRAAQRDAARGRSERPFRDVLGDDPEVTATLDDGAARRVLRPEARARERRPRRSTRSTTSGRAARRERQRSLPHLYSGKVRELYEVGDDALLMVASRPHLGVRRRAARPRSPTRAGCSPRLARSGSSRPPTSSPNHVISCDPDRLPRDRGPDVAGPGDARAGGPSRSGSSASCAATSSGAAWNEYQEHGHGAGPRRCRPGCGRPSGCPSRSSRRRPRPTTGHDLPLTDAEAVDARRRRRRSSSCATSRSRSTRAAPAHARRARAHPRRHQVRVRRASTASSSSSTR